MTPRAPRATMKDVAERAGVSTSAVSFAYNNPGRLARSTVEQIHKAAEELGYVRDPAARMLRTRTTRNMGLLLPQPIDDIFANPYYAELIAGIGQVCTREGMFLLLIPPLKGSLAESVPVSVVDGFLVVGIERDRSEIRAIQRQQMPFVVIDGDPLAEVPAVGLDEVEATGEVTRHLLDLGHRDIQVLAFESGQDAGPSGWHGTLLRRYEGVREAIEDRGLTSNVRLRVTELPCTREAGSHWVRRIWDSGDRPSAFLCFSDVIALGALDALNEHGVDVPGEVSVTGFDDIPEARWARPSLTTVRQSIRTKGRLAADRLVDAIAANRTPDESFTLPEHQTIHGSLVVRDSSGPAQSHRHVGD
ncbi:MAG: LacI family DNA-binding transcriptional regulator [Actinomyces succiniciruminis]|nr:LacI family DNA-binding transcriptional regulator [Actinomyces succiniciruminis]